MNVHNFFLLQMSHEDQRILHSREEWMSALDFHSFVCHVPRDGSIFAGQVLPPPYTGDFHVFEDAYDFEEEEENEIDPERMNPAYVSHLVKNGFAFVSNGKIIISEDYFRRVGSRERKGNESFFHRYLVTRAYFFFRKMGYDIAEGVEYRGHRPDLTIMKDGEMRPVECEFSDVGYRKRMMEKIETYGNSILATFNNFLNKIPEGVDVLPIPPVGDPSEPRLIRGSLE
ncbi:MAG: hypothetical protein ACP5UO_01960 [Thermoplasmata archaeon]